MTITSLRRTGTVAALVAAFTAAPFLLADSAVAQGGGKAVQSTGTCTGGGHFKLKAKHDDARIQVEYEVDTNKIGQVWAVTVTDNGVTVFKGAVKTTGPSGSFSVRKVIADRPGTDTLRAHATLGARACGGAVTL